MYCLKLLQNVTTNENCNNVNVFALFNSCNSDQIELSAATGLFPVSHLSLFHVNLASIVTLQKCLRCHLQLLINFLWDDNQQSAKKYKKSSHLSLLVQINTLSGGSSLHHRPVRNGLLVQAPPGQFPVWGHL